MATTYPKPTKKMYEKVKDFTLHLEIPMEMVIYWEFANPHNGIGYPLGTHEKGASRAFAVSRESQVCHSYIADLLILDVGYDLVEIEVKRSWADFLRDFSHKKLKHEMYMRPTNEPEKPLMGLVPHKMYFAFPTKELCEKAKVWLKKNGFGRYGIYYATDGLKFKDCEIKLFKRCQRLFPKTDTWQSEYRKIIRDLTTDRWFIDYFKDRQFRFMLDQNC